jgi:hypothetical protein
MKKYRITYAPTIKLAQEVVDPYDDWNSANVLGEYFYTSIPNHDRSYVETIEVEALSKETAKAAFVIEIYNRLPLNRSIRGGYQPAIFDAVRNIKSIEEIHD